jgi:glutathione S-transferase
VLRVYHAPLTRSVRILWLLEELGLPYEAVRVEFAPPASGFFSQKTPLGKFPVLEDGELVMAESGAILEYVLERYGGGRLAPPVGSPARGPFLQWIHFSEGTLYPPLGTIVWHTFYKRDAASLPAVIDDARGRAHSALDFLARALDGSDYLLGAEFSAADIMMGYSLIVARTLGVLADQYPELERYLGRLEARPAFATASVA